MRSRSAALWLAIVPSSACLSEETRAYDAARSVLCLVIVLFLPCDGGALIAKSRPSRKRHPWFVHIDGRLAPV